MSINIDTAIEMYETITSGMAFTAISSLTGVAVSFKLVQFDDARHEVFSASGSSLVSIGVTRADHFEPSIDSLSSRIFGWIWIRVSRGQAPACEIILNGETLDIEVSS